MERSRILEKLKEILALTIPNEEMIDYNESLSLVDDLGLNSVGILYIVIGIEEVFSITFEGISFNDFNTIGDVIDYIEERI